MVKIEGRTAEEEKAIAKAKTLVAIAQEVFPGCKISQNQAPYYLHIHISGNEEPISVFLRNQNQITVNREDLLQPAIKLAEAYEERTREEFTVKKDYSEPKPDSKP